MSPFFGQPIREGLFPATAIVQALEKLGVLNSLPLG
jgi:hypothetical protein